MHFTAFLETRLKLGMRDIGASVGFTHLEVSVPHPGNNGYRAIFLIPGFSEKP